MYSYVVPFVLLPFVCRAGKVESCDNSTLNPLDFCSCHSMVILSVVIISPLDGYVICGTGISMTFVVKLIMSLDAVVVPSSTVTWAKYVYPDFNIPSGIVCLGLLLWASYTMVCALNFTAVDICSVYSDVALMLSHSIVHSVLTSDAPFVGVLMPNFFAVKL